MTEKLNKSGLQEDFLIDKIADKVSKSKLIRALFGVSTIAGVGSTAACVTPPPAEVAPVNEAVLSGVIGHESVDKLSGNSKIIVENSLAYIGNKYAEDEKFVPGTEMIYAVGRGTDSFAWYLAGFENEDGSVGLRVTDYCDSFVRDNENCQNVERDLLMVGGEGNRLYGFIDENNEQHPILLIDKNDNPTAFDVNGSSYAEKVANSDGFVDKIMSIGAMNVQAAAPEATAVPQVGETLLVVDTLTATAEPTATATETPTVTPSVEVDELGIRKEFARGETMTKTEIKANVDWFYNMSDDELNKLVEGNLWSWHKYEGDSRPRDIDGNILSNKEDLGLFFSRQLFVGGGYSEIRNYFNGVFLGTTGVLDDEGSLFYLSAFGSKDFLGNRFVVYGGIAISGGENYGVVLGEKLLNSTIFPSDAKPVSNVLAIEKLLNNHLREVVAFDLVSSIKFGSYSPPDEISKLVNLAKSNDDFMRVVNDQINGNYNESIKEYVDERIPLLAGKLRVAYSVEDISNFFFMNSTFIKK